jgi:hypothetical protein
MDRTPQKLSFATGLKGVPAQSISTAPQKRCRYCLVQYPIEQFRLRSTLGATRLNQCQLCHNQAERIRRQHKRGVLTKRQLKQQLTSLKNQQTAKGVERVYLHLCERFGGTEGLLRLWTESMEKDMAEGGFKAYRHIASILRLMEHYEGAHLNKPNYSQMSDEELLEALAKSSM